MRWYSTIIFIFLCSVSVWAQTGTISGIVSNGEDRLPFANVGLEGTSMGSSTDAQGRFFIDDVPAGDYVLQISAVGFVPVQDSISLKSGQEIDQEFSMRVDVFNLSQIVITGSRNSVERYNSPVIVNTVDAKTLESIQSVNIADGLNFSPGLRVENNCQNCGFTQLRMNGLDGPYSQILINSRPVFSALAGVYGLEMIPSEMVDRIEVVRGGGSVMYGGNAIAGTVNIITKEPFENTFQAGINQSFINGDTSDRTANVNASIVSEDFMKGVTIFGFNRQRDPWDANGDGFSEVVKLENNTFGFDAFYHLDDRNELKLGAYYINEFRRGGNQFDLLPHQTDLTEQLEHDILSTNLSFDHLSKNEKHRFSVYGSAQFVDRASYYGGGGRVIADGDTLSIDDVIAVNAYGNSQDFSTVSGLQYNHYINEHFTLTAGSEYIYNDVIDEMPGYGRAIDQQVGTWGTFAELEVKPMDRLTLLAGGRLDRLRIDGIYDLADERFEDERSIDILVPRISAMYNLRENLKLRASFAQGYRGPQAFDEDLHIETVGGSALFIRLDPDLEVERSNSGVLSLNYDKYVGDKQMNFVIEGFYTQLSDPFILGDQTELDNGVAVITKRNGSGAIVSGLNLEANIAFGNELILQSGATIQTALYDEEEEIWSSEDAGDASASTTTERLLRTPDAYGYFSLVYNASEALAISYSGVYTGSMDVPHVIDVETERTIIETTPTFFENNIKLSYTFRADDRYKVELFGGVQNIFDSYQDDFDLGAERDAGYIYGPLRPRVFFMGLRFGLD